MVKQIFWITSGFGVQLNNWHYNANHCTINNKMYFVTKQRLRILCSIRKHKDDSANGVPYFEMKRVGWMISCVDDCSANPNEIITSPHTVKVEDKIRFSRFKIGVIRFIGITEETGTDEILLALSFVLFLVCNNINIYIYILFVIIICNKFVFVVIKIRFVRCNKCKRLKHGRNSVKSRCEIYQRQRMFIIICVGQKNVVKLDNRYLNTHKSHFKVRVSDHIESCTLIHVMHYHVVDHIWRGPDKRIKKNDPDGW
ncbi:hypothetical protein RFI_28374 [Reticulomyxa filosa]|uniref:Uncharacterized protein n=1 Tax=Reticulomyxa filosa TaxID=46433 RepID=X6M4V4_RETFI|nr:hypothetical protein RFI_28374 [Reticulomyxa filosa]|eukprot:ETO09013.1 hypothetical protein RFI_28374 [Reticulomyxa filosa]